MTFLLSRLICIYVSLKNAYCLAIPCLGSEGDFDDVCVTVQCCKSRYNMLSLHSVRGSLSLLFFSMSVCVCAIVSHKPLIALIMKDIERRIGSLTLVHAFMKMFDNFYQIVNIYYRLQTTIIRHLSFLFFLFTINRRLNTNQLIPSCSIGFFLFHIIEMFMSAI
jgi:hypothetical protein